ncbi:MAG TPA: HAMP domain-containing sensor histidine kinase [Thermoanaerobaculia bacterium]|nr:HAMP domain-containing sensor histidine kinase [Thermoanaerobaculia bacterium]
MQIWTKLTLGFGVTAMAIAGGYGSYQVYQEGRDLRSVAERDLRLVGSVAATAVAESQKGGAAPDLHAVIAAVRPLDPSVELLLLDEGGGAVASSPGSRWELEASRRLAAEARRQGQPILRFEGPAGLSRLTGAFPIRAGEGTLEMVKSLDYARADLASETRGTALSLLALVVGLCVAGWLLASLQVRRPLEALVREMRASRSGERSAAIPIRRDEIGAVVSEFNVLMGHLADARRRLIAESEAREALETKLEHSNRLVTVGQLSAGLAHEIGSPLQILNGRARALANRGDLPVDVRRSAEILSNESDRIARIVEQLLTFSRRSAPCKVNAVLSAPVREVAELFLPEARRHGIRLEVDCDGGIPPVRADVGQVQQIVMNLLSNAIRATPPNGRVRVALGSDGHAPAAAGAPRGIRLVVEDTGPGIPDAILTHLFEPFFTSHAEAGGTGLGLSIVKSIVDAHGGSIEVNGRVGGGSRFEVFLPATSGGGIRGAIPC